MAFLGYSSDRGYIERRFLLDAIGYLRDLVDGVGWDASTPGTSGCCAGSATRAVTAGCASTDRADLAAAVDQTVGALAAVDRDR